MKLKIEGMHCASCEVLIEHAFKKIPGVSQARVHRVHGVATVECACEIPVERFQEVVEEHGYHVSLWDEADSVASVVSSHKNTPNDYFQIGAIFLLLMTVELLLKQANLIPDLGISEGMSYGFVFVIGLVAAVSSCIAVSGGLLLAVAAKYNERHPDLTRFQKFKPHLFFNVGRIVSYTLLGGLVGLVGSAITLSPRVNGVLIILVSLVMISLGFQLLKLFPGLQRFQPKPPKFLAHWIYELETKNAHFGAFVLGGLTFFLPCGFTQALQLYVLSQGDFVTGALTMLAFSLGTLPALLSLSAVSSFARGETQKTFLRFAGVAVVLIGLSTIGKGMTLAGINLDFASAWSSSQSETSVAIPVTEGKQIVEMTVSGYSYSPAHFVVQTGIPVEWRIAGQDAAGCGKVLVSADLNLSQYLSPTDVTVVNFTPMKTGEISFNCSMGMMTPGWFTVVETESVN